MALPDNTAEFPVETHKNLYLAVGKAGVESKELSEGEPLPSLPAERCPRCGREM